MLRGNHSSKIEQLLDGLMSEDEATYKTAEREIHNFISAAHGQNDQAALQELARKGQEKRLELEMNNPHESPGSPMYKLNQTRIERIISLQNQYIPFDTLGRPPQPNPPGPAPQPRSATPHTAQFVLLRGSSISRQNFAAQATAKGCDPKRTVLIFPGNPTHHTDQTTLYSKKSGDGLGRLGDSLGSQGNPVLSLPTTGMEDYATNPAKQAMAKKAVDDLWRAIGAGYAVALPTRSKQGNYFQESLDETPGLEPSFWGGVQTAANPELAEYYRKEIEKMRKYMKDRKAANIPAANLAAFQQGQNKQPPAWFVNPRAAQMGFGEQHPDGRRAAPSRMLTRLNLLDPQVTSHLCDAPPNGLGFTRNNNEFTAPNGGKYEITGTNQMQALDDSPESFEAMAEHLKQAAIKANVPLDQVPVWIQSDKHADAMKQALEKAGFKKIEVKGTSSSSSKTPSKDSAMDAMIQQMQQRGMTPK